MKMTPLDWSHTAHFRPSEFPHPEQMEVDLIRRLDHARELAGIPFVLNSSYRSPGHNAEVGGANDSAHTRGFAVDIRATTSRNRFYVVRGLIRASFNRLCVYPTHVHADVDPSLDDEVMWVPPPK